MSLACYFGEDVIEVTIAPRRNSKAICSGCNATAPGYDSLSERRFEFISLLGYRVFFLYVMRRINCKTCGIKVEQVPWARGKKELTTTYMQYLAFWAEKLSWQDVARNFRRSSWEPVVWHLKHDFRLTRNWLKKSRGEAIILLLAVSAWNFRKWMTIYFLFEYRGYLWVRLIKTDAHHSNEMALVRLSAPSP